MQYLGLIAAAVFALVLWNNSGSTSMPQDERFMRECAAHGGKFTPFPDPRYATCDLP